MKEMLTRMVALARHGALTRPLFGKPRGTRTEAAARRVPVPGHYYPGTPAWFTVIDEPFDLETYLWTVPNVSDTALRQAAIEVLGEFGDASCVAVLSAVLHTDASVDPWTCEDTRRRASHALASIGGPEAEESLWRALENPEYSTDVREEALQCLLDLLTPDGWENYTFMNPVRVALSAADRARLLRVRGLSYEVAWIVETFDVAEATP